MDYYRASKYEKAKSNLFMLKIFSPFWAYVFIASYVVIGFDAKLLLLAIILAYIAISASYTIKKEEKL